MRAYLDLKVLAPAEDWVVIANGSTKSVSKVENHELANVEEDGEQEYWEHTFDKIEPISTYIFNMCAGQYDVIHNENKDAIVEMRIFLRNSKKDNIDAQELFRVVDEGIRFFEKYTSTKYPW